MSICFVYTHMQHAHQEPIVVQQTLPPPASSVRPIPSPLSLTLTYASAKMGSTEQLMKQPPTDAVVCILILLCIVIIIQWLLYTISYL